MLPTVVLTNQKLSRPQNFDYFLFSLQTAYSFPLAMPAKFLRTNTQHKTSTCYLFYRAKKNNKKKIDSQRTFFSRSFMGIIIVFFCLLLSWNYGNILFLLSFSIFFLFVYFNTFSRTQNRMFSLNKFSDLISAPQSRGKGLE